MKFHWVMVLLALACFSAPASAQEMKMGDKSWNDLQKTLEDVNLQWLCAGKYFKAKQQDCVNFRAKYWADEFFRSLPQWTNQHQGTDGCSTDRCGSCSGQIESQGHSRRGAEPAGFQAHGRARKYRARDRSDYFQDHRREWQPQSHVRGAGPADVREGEWNVETRRSSAGEPYTVVSYRRAKILRYSGRRWV